VKLLQHLRSYFVPGIILFLYTCLLIGTYLYEHHLLLTDTSQKVISRWTNELSRMDMIVEKTINDQDQTRIEDELLFVSTDLDLKTYLLLDATGKILYANHSIWRGSNAAEVIDTFSPMFQHQVVNAASFSTLVNYERSLLTIYYPLQSAHAAFGKYPQIIYLEYDLYPAIAAADNVFKSRFILSWGIVSLLLLVVLGLTYLSFLKPIKILINSIGKNAIPIPSFWIAEELAVLQQCLLQHQQQQNRLIKQLKDNEQRWLFAIDSTRNGIWDWNIASRDVFLSDRWKEMLGFRPEEIADSFTAWKERLHPDEADHILAALQSFLDGETDQFELLHRLRHKDGHYLWILDRGMIIAWDNAGCPTRMIGTHMDVSEDINNQQTLAHLSSYDSLTNLVNRNSLMELLKTAVHVAHATNSYSALLCLDLDNFKIINDALGHHIGDRLLVQLATRLSDMFAKQTVARLSGDEFVILLNNISQNEASATTKALMIAGELRHVIAASFNIDGRQLHVSASVGIHLINTVMELNAEELLRRVEMAMFAAKENGRDGCVVYTAELEQRTNQNLLLQNDLRNAINQQQLRLYYQPIVQRDGKIVAAEALLRWCHPKLGFVSPAEFIPVAEHSGLIIELSRWVIAEACRFINSLAAKNCVIPRISINISARQFNHIDFVPSFLSAIAEFQVAPAQLQLELTEHLLLTDLSVIQDKFEALRQAGIAVAIDDFGTGYSSLSYLQHLSLTQLKIDQSFVKQIGCSHKADAIVSTIVNMAHALELQVVAEGVETPEQRQFLLNVGCDSFQGFLWSKPVPAASFTELLTQEFLQPEHGNQ